MAAQTIAKKEISEIALNQLIVMIVKIHVLEWNKLSQDFRSGVTDTFPLAMVKRNIHIKPSEWLNGEIYWVKEKVEIFWSIFPSNTRQDASILSLKNNLNSAKHLIAIIVLLRPQLRLLLRPQLRPQLRLLLPQLLRQLQRLLNGLHP